MPEIERLKNRAGVLLACVFLCACGLEDYPYINPVPQSNVTQEMNYRAVVRLPNSYAGTPFTHFAVFYRIYVSNMPQSSTQASTFSMINPVLVSDHNTFRSYIDSTTLVNANMESVFQGRGYRLLNLDDGVNINAVLSEAALGGTLTFDFSSSRLPTITIGSSTYTLLRADGGGLFTPQPDRYFRNTADLSRAENITSTINADVVNLSGITAGDQHYTYAAMYITAVGVNTATYSNIYSTPALIHVFQLPN